MSEQFELKPCKCGGKAALRHKCFVGHCGWGKSFLVYWVECETCEDETEHFRSPRDAADAWNRRVGEED